MKSSWTKSLPRGVRQSPLRRIVESTTFTETCWLWRGATLKGYGQIGIAGQQVAVHIYAFKRFNGPIPPGREVCHTCDVRNCWRPSHLWSGSRSDNMRDAFAKGRGPLNTKAIEHSKALSVLVKEAYNKPGVRYSDVAEQFGLSIRQIGYLLHND